MLLISFLFKGYRDHRYLHVLTHSFPTRRPADLKAGDYADADRQKVEILLPHRPRALHLGQRLAGTSLVQASSFDALASLDIGILVVDRSRRIVHANVLAEDMLRTSPEIGVLNGRLVMRDHTLRDRKSTRLNSSH